MCNCGTCPACTRSLTFTKRKPEWEPPSTLELRLGDGFLGGWEVLIDCLERARASTGLQLVWDSLIDQIEAQIAPPKPPKPEEPLGLGAVVEYDGSRWVSLGRNRWLEVPADEAISARSLHWDDFYADVEILSQGVTS